MAVEQELRSEIIVLAGAFLGILFLAEYEVGHRMGESDVVIMRQEKLIQTLMQAVGRDHCGEEIQELADMTKMDLF